MTVLFQIYYMRKGNLFYYRVVILFLYLSQCYMEFYPSNFQIENKNNEREHFLKIYDIIATFKIKFIPIVYFFYCLFIYSCF